MDLACPFGGSGCPMGKVEPNEILDRKSNGFSSISVTAARRRGGGARNSAALNLSVHQEFINILFN